MNEFVRMPRLDGPGHGDGVDHVRACVEDTCDADLANADVLYFSRPTTPAQVAAQLEIYPGCIVCAGSTADGSLLIAVRDRRDPGYEHTSFIASVVHALLVRRLRAS